MTRYEKQFYETLINELPKISKELKEIKEQIKQKTINSTISSSLPKDPDLNKWKDNFDERLKGKVEEITKEKSPDAHNIMQSAVDGYVQMMKQYDIDLSNKE